MVGNRLSLSLVGHARQVAAIPAELLAIVKAVQSFPSKVFLPASTEILLENNKYSLNLLLMNSA
jgi:hypothetical protein